MIGVSILVLICVGFALFFLDWEVTGFICVVVGTVAAIIALAVTANQETERLMSQCLADGKKEYECTAMFKREHTPVYMPIIIPMR